jgi:hypothetical protein
MRSFSPNYYIQEHTIEVIFLTHLPILPISAPLTVIPIGVTLYLDHIFAAIIGLAEGKPSN